VRGDLPEISTSIEDSSIEYYVKRLLRQSFLFFWELIMQRFRGVICKEYFTCILKIAGLKNVRNGLEMNGKE